MAETVKTNVETMAHYYADTDNDTKLVVTALIGNTDMGAICQVKTFF